MSSARRAAASALLLAAFVACASSKPKKTSTELLLTERMGQVLLREGKPVEAERAFRDALKQDPKNPEVWDGLGVSLVMQRQFHDALVPLDKAVELAPKKASYRNNRGVARMELGQYAEAEEDFSVAEASPDPEDRLSATINRGRLRQRQGDFAAAEQDFSLALARDPRSFAAMFGRAGVREARGDLEGAAEDYLGAVRLDPRSAEANLRLGLLLVMLKKPDLGRRYLERAVDLDPTGDTGAKARMVLQGMGRESSPKTP